MRCHQNRYPKTRANVVRPLKALGALTAVALMIFAVSIPAALAQDSPPDYRVTRLQDNSGETFRPGDINEAGVVVGSNQGAFMAFMYSQAMGVQNLNELGATWFDLPSGNSANGWKTWKASGINEDGLIVGTATHPDVDGIPVLTRVFVLDPLASPPIFTLLPKFGNVGNIADAINDDGVVVGTAGDSVIVFDPRANNIWSEIPNVGTNPSEINKDGIIVTSNPLEGGYVISPSGFNTADGSWIYDESSPQYFPGDEFYGINDANMICGLRPGKRSGSPSQRHHGGAFRFQYPGTPGEHDDEDILLVDYSVDAYYCDVNELGDVAFMSNNRGFIYLEGSSAPFNLDQYVVLFDSPADVTTWMNSRIQPQGINDAGQIIIRFGGNDGYLLTPIVSGPPIAGITVSPTSGLTTTESGGTATFTVKLDTVPEFPVMIDLSSSEKFLGTINGATNNVLTLEFTDDSSQTVTVTGVDDDPPISDGPHPYTIITEAAVSIDSAYSGLDVDDVSITNLDNDAPPGGGTYNFPLPEEWLLFPMSIPDRSTVLSTIVVPVADDFQIANMMTVNLDISHERPSDLRVTLIGPDGITEAPLTNFTGDNNVTAFDNHWTGDTMWILKIRDVKKKQSGTLHGWSITVETQ